MSAGLGGASRALAVAGAGSRGGRRSGGARCPRTGLAEEGGGSLIYVGSLLVYKRGKDRQASAGAGTPNAQAPPPSRPPEARPLRLGRALWPASTRPLPTPEAPRRARSAPASRAGGQIAPPPRCGHRPPGLRIATRSPVSTIRFPKQQPPRKTIATTP